MNPLANLQSSQQYTKAPLSLPRRAPIAAALAMALIPAANSGAQTSSFGRVYDPPPQIIPPPPLRPQPPLWKREWQFEVPKPQRRREIRFYPGTDNPTWKGAYPGTTKPNGRGAARKRPRISRQPTIVPHRSATIRIIPEKKSDEKSENPFERRSKGGQEIIYDTSVSLRMSKQSPNGVAELRTGEVMIREDGQLKIVTGLFYRK